MISLNLQRFGGRGGGSGAIPAFYQNRLASIDASIQHHKIVASLAGSRNATVRKKAQAAQRSIERLRKEYAAVEKAGRAAGKSGPKF